MILNIYKALLLLFLFLTVSNSCDEEAVIFACNSCKQFKNISVIFEL